MRKNEGNSCWYQDKIEAMKNKAAEVKELKSKKADLLVIGDCEHQVPEGTSDEQRQ